MSIKKLFDISKRTLQYSDYETDKVAYESVESRQNVEEIDLKQMSYTPPVDYADPVKFVRFGSAYYYYKGALTRISEYYPYDGSDAEKNKFYNGLLDVEKYIFDNNYPTTTGYINTCAGGWGSRTSTSDGYGLPATLEYITFKGGPVKSPGTSLVAQSPNPYSDKIHSSNIYDENMYENAGLPSNYGSGTRLSNLRADFTDGVTVEFWLKTGSINYSNHTQKQVIFDAWNNYGAGTGDYGRMTIAVHTASAASPSTSAGNAPLYYTIASGSSAGVRRTIGTGSVATASFGSWNHYALTFANSGSDFVAKLYVNGNLNATNVHTSTNISALNSKNMMGRLGALMAAPREHASAVAGAGKLSGSIDEFRYWKVRRDGAQIAENYFVPVNGGTNTDISNTTLGVYYKFNEGIVGTSAEDSVVLDYAGRISNGAWTGYVSSASRNTGSAIVSASAAASESPDPIIRQANPRYQALSSSLMSSGSWFDSNNSSKFSGYVPNWVLEEQERNGNHNLDIICHIMGAYFDKLYFLSSQIPKLRQLNYTTASHTPFPYAGHLPASLGMSMPDIFVDASVRERFLDRTDTGIFEGDLDEVKNLIYLNLYNNLTNIYKSKGTEKAIRNVMRCFYLDDSLFRLNTYSTNNIYDLRNNVRQHIAADSAIDFATGSGTSAIVYQRYDSTNPESQGYISGSGIDPDEGTVDHVGDPRPEDSYGFTTEASIMFPYYVLDPSQTKVERNFATSSLFGCYTVKTASTTPVCAAPCAAFLNGTDPTFANYDYANFQVYAIRARPYSRNVRFMLTSSRTPLSYLPMAMLTSSTFMGVYNDESWNFSVRLKPQNANMAGFVSGSRSGSYDLIFRGNSTKVGALDRSFEVSTSVNYLTGTMLARAPKRLYVGANRTNFTGAVMHPSDVKVLDLRHWLTHVNSASLNTHALDTANHGISGSYRNLTEFPSAHNSLGRTDMLNLYTLALNWTFDNVTTSDGSGNFTVQDNSSGSALIRDNFGWLGKRTGYQHDGYGYGFDASFAGVVDNQDTNLYKFVNPENAIGSDMIQILSEDDKVFGVPETVPNYLFTIEKSMYDAISEEMLKFFAGVADFNNVIGAPVNRYRSRYKDMEKLREAFFRRVTTVSNVEKFVDYYKWFDDALTTVISQLIPASAHFVNDVMNTIESHVLERNKYTTPFPTLDVNMPDLDSDITTWTEVSPYTLASTTQPSSPRDTTKHEYFWKNVAIRTGSLESEIGSGNPTVDSQRDIIKNVVSSEPAISGTLPVLSTVGGVQYQRNTLSHRRFQRLYKISSDSSILTGSTVKGGVNFDKSKNIDFTYNALRPAGPVNTEGNGYVPQNVLLSLGTDFISLRNVHDPPTIPSAKVKRFARVQHGRQWQDGQGYANVSSKMAFPFNLISGTVNSGYQKLVSDSVSGSIIITNVHNDVYGPDMEKPMQGPFTEYAVGGHQSRHVSLNTGSDNYRNRPEAWKILMGTCVGQSGAIGMVGPDYPWPEANEVNATPYPMTASQKAVYYRDYVAKRPVNIRNIRHTTGSTILGNYNHNYDVVSTFGAYSNPLAFRDTQPTLPANVLQYNATSSTTAKTILDIRRSDNNHFEFVADYSIAYLTGAAANQTVFRNRFGAPGGIETATPAYNDFRADEYSVYNTINERNLTVRRPWQGPSGTYSQPIGSGTTGIRISDIHGKDYGLVSQLSRHTARFGRDSLFVTSAGNLPGASYTQLPGFHKVHRNNIGRIKKTDSIVYTTIGPLSNVTSSNFISPNNRGPALVLTSSTDGWDDGTKLYQALTSSGFTYSGWLYFAPGSPVRRFFNMGRTSAGAFAGINIAKLYSSSEHRIRVNMAFADSGDSNRGSAEWHCSGAAEETWMHIAVTWTGSNGSLTSVDPKIYINGVSQTVTEDTAPPYDHYPQNWRASATYKGFSNCLLTGDNMVMFGGNHSVKTWSYTGSMDEISIWKRPLNSSEVSELYNGGVPCDVTSSNTYIDSSSVDLWEWIRMGDGKNGHNAIDVNNPGTVGTSNRITGEINGLYFMPVSENGGNNEISFNTALASASPAILTGCPEKIKSTTEVSTYSSSSLYDNFYIKHQIPRMTKQYAWITASVISTNNWPGIVPPNFKISNSSGIVNAYDFVSASALGAVAASSGKYSWVVDIESSIPTAQKSLLQRPNMAGINVFTIDPVNTSTCLQGTDGPVSSYINRDFVSTTNALASASLLNVLNFSRNGPYGWPTWKQIRNADKKIVQKLRSQNQLVLNMGNTPSIPAIYEMPPVSLRGRPGVVNFSNGDEIYTLQATFTNDRIYFNTPDLDNKLDVSLTNFSTPFEQAIQVARQYDLNWVKYTQNIYPSIRNEFMSRSTQRLGYDNKFWRTSLDNRLTVGSALSNSCGIFLDSIAYFGGAGTYSISQSCFPLDAPYGFLTRSSADNWTATIASKGGAASVWAPRQAIGNLAVAGGELQNGYSTYLANSGYGEANAAATTLFYRPAALYARKHQLTTPASNVGPTGIRLPETGAINRSIFLAKNQCSGTFAGEAVWQAGSLAGVVRKTGNDNTNRFLFSSSAPWYNSYDDFNADLKLLARGFSTVPEFRISPNVSDYLEAGTIDNGKTDSFEIVGTDINSSTVTNGTASFYLDYSNSEFLEDFLSIKQDSLLNAAEIKMVCSAACKFVPYKGFYPADRSLQLVEQFKKDYADTMNGTALRNTTEYDKSGPGDLFTGPWGGFTKMTMAPLFNPGILYNSIKSGLAVDWPLVTQGSKFQKVYYGQLGQFDGDNAQNWAITCRSGASGARPLYGSYDITNPDSSYNQEMLGFNRTFFDTRVPFEGIIYPEQYLDGVNLFDMDAHPSSSVYAATASYAGTPGESYSRMMRNFLGAVPSFFLADNSFSKLSTPAMSETMTFNGDEVYMARLKVYRSMSGSRNYSHESASANYYPPATELFTTLGACGVSNYTTQAPHGVHYLTGTSYPLPQDPRNAPDYHESFTMYSRPTAFGPPMAALGGGALCLSGALYTTNTIYDSFSGHNPAYTPPYYDGESWCDLIFRPLPGVSYNLARIVSEATASYLRFDAGYQSGSMLTMTPSYGCGPRTPLIYTPDSFPNRSTAVDVTTPSQRPAIAPYSGVNINKNSMQVSASLRLFGIETVELTQTDKFGLKDFTRNTSTGGQRWVIQPRFETPMLNFNNTGTRPLTSSQLSLPTFASCSVPRGMWHQFGIIEPDQNKGIFMEIGDLPSNWLTYNHLIINTGSVYNQFSTANGAGLSFKVKSLCDLVGFDSGTSKKRLGQLKESIKVKEAIVAVPYVIQNSVDTLTKTVKGEEAVPRKQFISIPRERFEASLEAAFGSAEGDSLDAAGASIRKQVEKMESYIMPPEFDFIQNTDLEPVAMYIFEFEHTFDQDDLSYIWQNLAPRKNTMSVQHDSVGHELLTTELLSEENLSENESLRWMIFKVKQRGQEDYYNYLTTEAGKVPYNVANRLSQQETGTGYNLAYNWPYDYMSLVERVKIDVEILYKEAPTDDADPTTGRIDGLVTDVTTSRTGTTRASSTTRTATSNRSSTNRTTTTRTAGTNLTKKGNY